jgi:hypothetical protein
MKTIAYVAAAAAFLAGAAALLLFPTGCETGSGLHALTVEPAEANLLDNSGSNVNNTVTFMVTEGLRGLSLPLKWDVSTPELGEIIHEAGNGATYQRTSLHGINSVYVEDQYGASGLASVRQ